MRLLPPDTASIKRCGAAGRGMPAPIITAVRRESSTVVGLVGELPERLLAELGRSPNVSVIRPPAGAGGSLEAAVAALREASRRLSPFVLVAADPLALVADSWRQMWDVSGGAAGPTGFEQQAAAALAAWQAGRFELPDYYLVVTAAADQPDAQAGPDFYLGPLRATRPRRVTALPAADVPELVARVRQALRSLRHGPWWPPLPEVVETARGFYTGGLAEGAGPQSTQNSPGQPRPAGSTG
jgi:hypothetical protein